MNGFLSPEYWLAIILLLFAVWQHNNKKIFFITWIYLLCLALFRGLEVGTDLMKYELDYYALHKMEDVHYIYHYRFEPGFVSSIICAKRYLGLDYLSFASLLFLPFYVGAIHLAKYRNVNFSIYLLVLFLGGYYFLACNIMRQMMAIGMALFFIKWLYEGKYKYFFLAILTISFLFHRSSFLIILLVPLHYLYRKYWEFYTPKRYLYIALFSSLVLFFIGQRFLQSFLLSLSSFLFDGMYDVYFLGLEDKSAGEITVILTTIFSIIVVYFHKNKSTNFELIVCVFGVCLGNILGMMSLYANRMAIPFEFFYVVLIPSMFIDKTIVHRKLFIITSIVFLFGKFMYCYYLHNSCAINPYYIEYRNIFPFLL